MRRPTCVLTFSPKTRLHIMSIVYALKRGSKSTSSSGFSVSFASLHEKLSTRRFIRDTIFFSLAPVKVRERATLDGRHFSTGSSPSNLRMNFTLQAKVSMRLAKFSNCLIITSLTNSGSVITRLGCDEL